MREMEAGSLYKTFDVEGKIFDVIYGYHSDAKKEECLPSPVFPDFLKEPMYTDKGKPFATAYQDICPHYKEKANSSGENWCNDCIFFHLHEEIIGVCECKENERKT